MPSMVRGCAGWVMRRALLVLALTSCAQGSAERIVYLDASFSPDERAAIERGLDGWGATVDLSTRRTAEHASLFTPAAAGEWFVVRSSGPEDCPHPIPDGPHIAATVYRGSYAPEKPVVTCIVAPRVTSWQHEAAHEAGHALGLWHVSDRPSVMARTPDQPNETELPTDEDINEACTYQ